MTAAPPSSARSWWLGALASAALASLGAVLALRLWKMSFSIPLRSSGDIMLSLQTVRTMQLSGWYLHTDLLGAPLGQDLRAYPGGSGDLWNMVALKAFSLFLSPAAAVNAFFLIGFPVIAAVTFLCLRQLRVSWWSAVALGAVYSWIPYHFLRGEGHLFLAAYAAVPIACLLVLAVLNRRLELGRGGRRLWLAAGGAAVLLGGTGLYYAVFAAVLLVSAGTLASIVARRWRPLLSGVALASTSAVVMVLGSLPTVLYVLVHGSPGVEGRSYAAVEYYGLKLTSLLMPVQSHRIHIFAQLRARLAESYIPGENMEALGLVGAAGLVLVVAAALIASRKTPLGRDLRRIGVVALIAFVWATVAGLSGVLAVAGFTQVRAWNRMSIVLAFLALAGVGLVLDHLVALAGSRRFLARGPGRRLIGPVAAGLLAVVALLDQTTDAMIPNYPAVRTAWTSDDAYFSKVDSLLGSGAAVFQLPIVPYPENPPVAAMADYEQLRGFLHSDLHWSYGAVKGSGSDWQSAAFSRGLTHALPALVSTGFDAIYINRQGYADHGAAVEAELAAALDDESPLVNSDGTLAVYDLRSYAEVLRASGAALPDSQTVLHPATLDFTAGLYDLETDGTTAWQWAGAEAVAGVSGTGTQEVVLTGVVSVATPGATVTVTVDSATTQLRADEAGTVTLDLAVTVHEGTRVVLSSDTAATTPADGDTRDLRMKLTGLTLAPTW
ncbi:MAG: hypothetical protein L6367_09395 [Cellulomonas sp.]|nr:hypothetical protein [Cellulomonas sp.]